MWDISLVIAPPIITFLEEVNAAMPILTSEAVLPTGSACKVPGVKIRGAIIALFGRVVSNLTNWLILLEVDSFYLSLIIIKEVRQRECRGRRIGPY